LRLQSIEFIRRENGFFRFRGKLIPAVRLNNGVGVAVLFRPSQVDEDFAATLDPETYLWFPSAKQIETILKALDKSDEQTAQMIPIKEWGGLRPRSLKLGDFV